MSTYAVEQSDFRTDSRLRHTLKACDSTLHVFSFFSFFSFFFSFFFFFYFVLSWGAALTKRFAAGWKISLEVGLYVGFSLASASIMISSAFLCRVQNGCRFPLLERLQSDHCCIVLGIWALWGALWVSWSVLTVCARLKSFLSSYSCYVRSKCGSRFAQEWICSSAL